MQLLPIPTPSFGTCAAQKLSDHDRRIGSNHSSRRFNLHRLHFPDRNCPVEDPIPERSFEQLNQALADPATSFQVVPVDLAIAKTIRQIDQPFPKCPIASSPQLHCT